MLGRYDQEGRRPPGKPGSARREPLELPLRGDPGQGALLGCLVNRHDEISARLQIIEESRHPPAGGAFRVMRHGQSSVLHSLHITPFNGP
jgi:hypothetical protein